MRRAAASFESVEKLTIAQAPTAPATRPMRIPTTYGTGPPIVRPVGSDVGRLDTEPAWANAANRGSGAEGRSGRSCSGRCRMLLSSGCRRSSRSLVSWWSGPDSWRFVYAVRMSRDPILLLCACDPQRGLDRVVGVSLAVERARELLGATPLCERALPPARALGRCPRAPSRCRRRRCPVFEGRRGSRDRRAACAASTRARSSAARSSD